MRSGVRDTAQRSVSAMLAGAQSGLANGEEGGEGEKDQERGREEQGVTREPKFGPTSQPEQETAGGGRVSRGTVSRKV